MKHNPMVHAGIGWLNIWIVAKFKLFNIRNIGHQGKQKKLRSSINFEWRKEEEVQTQF